MRLNFIFFNSFPLNFTTSIPGSCNLGSLANYFILNDVFVSCRLTISFIFIWGAKKTSTISALAKEIPFITQVVKSIVVSLTCI